MSELDILLPTYQRPHELARVARSIEDNTKTKFTLYFGLEKNDIAGARAAIATGHKLVINKYKPGYANTIQTIYEQSSGKYQMHANDDFEFLPDWEKAPIALLEEFKALMVIGLHDGNPYTNFWPVSMWRRSYIKDMSGVIDTPNRVFYPYNHNFIDTEFTETAIKRGVWQACPAPCIKHLHPSLVPKPSDATYDKNNATFQQDADTYSKRYHLFH